MLPRYGARETTAHGRLSTTFQGAISSGAFCQTTRRSTVTRSTHEPRANGEDDGMHLISKLREAFSDTRVIAAGHAAGLKFAARHADPNLARGSYERPLQDVI